MSSQYIFREATVSDLNLINQWTLDLIEHEALDASIELPLKTDYKEKVFQWLSTLINSENALFILAENTNSELHGCVLGMLQLVPNEFIDFTMQGLIQMVWVDKKYRRAGLAGQLVKQMEDSFKTLGVPYCEISFSVANSNDDFACGW